MRMMAGLDQPTAGRILLDGKDATGVPVRQRSVAMVYQQFMNYPSMTIYENILRRFASLGSVLTRSIGGCGTRGRPRSGNRYWTVFQTRSREVAATTHCDRAIVKDAELVCSTSRLANLDYKLREELREELPSILKASRMRVLVYATTEPLEALCSAG